MLKDYEQFCKDEYADMVRFVEQKEYLNYDTDGRKRFIQYSIQRLLGTMVFLTKFEKYGDLEKIYDEYREALERLKLEC